MRMKKLYENLRVGTHYNIFADGKCIEVGAVRLSKYSSKNYKIEKIAVYGNELYIYVNQKEV